MSYLDRLMVHLRQEDEFERELERKGRRRGSKFQVRIIENEGDPRGRTHQVEGNDLRTTFNELTEKGNAGDEIIISEVDNQGRLVETLPRIRRV